MHRDVETSILLELIESRHDRLYRLVAAVERGAEDRDDADRALVALRDRLLRAEVEAISVHRHEPRLDIPIAAELVPAHLHVDAHHEVGPIRRLAGRAHAL